MERIDGGTRRTLPNLAKIADPRERKAYQTYIEHHRRICESEPMSYEEWRAASQRLFPGYLPRPVVSEFDD